MRTVLSDYGQAPNELQRAEMAEVRRTLEGHLQTINQLINTEVAAFNKLALEHGASTLLAGTAIEIKSGSQTTATGDEN